MRCLYVLHNVCGKVLIMCGKVCDLNVLRPCDLSVHSITSPQKCQHRQHQKSHTELRKFISTSDK